MLGKDFENRETMLYKLKMKTAVLLSVVAANTCEDRYDGQCLDWDNFKVRIDNQQSISFS